VGIPLFPETIDKGEKIIIFQRASLLCQVVSGDQVSFAASAHGEGDEKFLGIVPTNLHHSRADITKTFFSLMFQLD